MHPVLIEFGGFTLPSYGVLVAAAYGLAIYWLKARADVMGFTEEKFWSFIYWIFFGALIGGKLFYIAVEHEAFASGEMSLWRDLRYGFVFFGGFAGSTAAFWLAWRRLGFDFWKVADYCGAALPLGHALGRLGCLAAGCCYGRPSGLPWALAMGGPPQSVTPSTLWGVPLHPVQLYEAAANLAIYVFLSWYMIPDIAAGRRRRGAAIISYILLYAAARFILEFFRGDDRGAWAGLATSQWLALAAGGAALFMTRRKV